MKTFFEGVHPFAGQRMFPPARIGVVARQILDGLPPMPHRTQGLRQPGLVESPAHEQDIVRFIFHA